MLQKLWKSVQDCSVQKEVRGDNPISFKRCLLPFNHYKPMKQTLYQKLKVSVYLCTTDPEFESIAPESHQIQTTNFRVNVVVLTIETWILNIGLMKTSKGFKARWRLKGRLVELHLFSTLSSLTRSTNCTNLIPTCTHMWEILCRFLVTFILVRK